MARELDLPIVAARCGLSGSNALTGTVWMWKPSLWGLAVALAMTASGGADAADYHTYDRTVFLGGAVELGRYIHVRTGCSPNGRDEIKVAKAPSSGSVRVVQKMAASKFSGDFQSCTGRLLPQLFVIYRPHAGFAGLDTVQVDVISPFGNEAIDTYNITVK